MRDFYLLLFILSINFLLTGCDHTDHTGSGTNSGSLVTNPGSPATLKALIAGADSVAVFQIDLDVSRDTVIHTPEGGLLQFPAGSIETGGNDHARLLIKESYAMSRMIRAGLLTTSNGKPLSSGGMIDIEAAAGQTLRIRRSISVSIPTPFIDSNMQLYKGVVDDKGKINWTNPQPLPANPQTKTLSKGKMLFQKYCVSCHALDKDMTGPELAYISRLRDKKWLYDFTRDSRSMILSKTDTVVDQDAGYARCLVEQYNDFMKAFPALTYKDLDTLYSYIDQESMRRGLAIPADHRKKCYDSCYRYEQAMEKSRTRIQELNTRRQELINANGGGSKIKRQLPPNYKSPDTVGPPVKIPTPFYQSVYYQFQIESFGWYNIDILLKNSAGVKDSKLIVRLAGDCRVAIHLFLAIPTSRVFAEGGPMDGRENSFGFYTQDGRIPLPQGAKCWILATGEKDGQFLFAMESFTATENQSIELSPLPVDKEEVNNRIRALDWQEIKLLAMDSKNADSIRVVDRNIDQIRKQVDALKPKECDCNCGKPRLVEAPENTVPMEATKVSRQSILGTVVP